MRRSGIRQGKPVRVAKQRSIYVHLPESLDLGQFVPAKLVQHAELVTGAIVYQRFAHHAAPADFVPFSYDFSRLILPDRTRRPVLLGLTGNPPVLECDGYYRYGPDGGKAYCFRLAPPYRDLPLKKRPITHPELIKKMRISHDAERSSVKHPTHKALRRWHDRVEVLPTAIYGVDVPLDLMIDGERRFKVCPMGRVHTNVVNLSREHRHNIRLAGQELWSVDISNSQPLILSLFLLRSHRGSLSPTGKAEGEGREENPPSVTHYDDLCLNEFRNHCLDGTIYDRISAVTGLSRDETKKRFLAVIYGRAEHMRTTTGEAVRNLYPSVHDACERFSLNHGNDWLARQMQRLESDVMILGVAGRIIREHPRVPALTVHDSILVPEQHIELVREVIADEWLAAFGIVPRTKVSHWTAPPQE